MTPPRDDRDADAHRAHLARRFGRAAAHYAQHRPVFDTERFLRLLAPTAGARVLDVGSGTGALALAAAHRAGPVVGVDVTPEMLRVAAAQAAAEGLPVRVVCGEAERLPFPEGAFDAVVSGQTLHHTLRPERIVREMARVLRPGGRLLVVDAVCSEDPAKAAVHNAYERQRDPSHVRFLPASELRALVQAAGCAVVAEETEVGERDLRDWAAFAGCSAAETAALEARAADLAAGDQAGINLRRRDGRWVFDMTLCWLLATRA